MGQNSAILGLMGKKNMGSLFFYAHAMYKVSGF